MTDRQHLRANDGPVTVVTAGTLPYLDAWRLQQRLADGVRAGRHGDVLLLLEHPRVYTLGRRADERNIVLDQAGLDRRGFEVHRVDRGGDVTYHGPGQLVGYPIVKLSSTRVVDFVRGLEELNIRLAGSFGIDARRIPDYTGVWVDRPDGSGSDKLTAIGVRVTGDVTQHGWATNVSTDLDDFSGIVPCGIDEPDKGVCSFASLGVDTGIDRAAERSAELFGEVFATDVTDADLSEFGVVV